MPSRPKDQHVVICASSSPGVRPRAGLVKTEQARGSSAILRHLGNRWSEAERASSLWLRCSEMFLTQPCTQRNALALLRLIDGTKSPSGRKRIQGTASPRDTRLWGRGVSTLTSVSTVSLLMDTEQVHTVTDRHLGAAFTLSPQARHELAAVLDKITGRQAQVWSDDIIDSLGALFLVVHAEALKRWKTSRHRTSHLVV